MKGNLADGSADSKDHMGTHEFPPACFLKVDSARGPRWRRAAVESGARRYSVAAYTSSRKNAVTGKVRPAAVRVGVPGPKYAAKRVASIVADMRMTWDGPEGGQRTGGREGRTMRELQRNVQADAEDGS